jgi:hypothetical protein
MPVDALCDISVEISFLLLAKMSSLYKNVVTDDDDVAVGSRNFNTPSKMVLSQDFDSWHFFLYM